MATPNHLPSRTWSSSSTNSNKKRQFTVFNDNASKILESRYVSYFPHDPNRLAGIAAFKYWLESLVPIYWLKSSLVYQNDPPPPLPPLPPWIENETSMIIKAALDEKCWNQIQKVRIWTLQNVILTNLKVASTQTMKILQINNSLT